MQIVIEIDKQMYENAKNDLLCGAGIMINAIKNGTPLPEHHGRLIDADFIKELGAKCIAVRANDNELYALGAIDALPTIIPATKEGDGE